MCFLPAFEVSFIGRKGNHALTYFGPQNSLGGIFKFLANAVLSIAIEIHSCFCIRDTRLDSKWVGKYISSLSENQGMGRVRTSGQRFVGISGVSGIL